MVKSSRNNSPTSLTSGIEFPNLNSGNGSTITNNITTTTTSTVRTPQPLTMNHTNMVLHNASVLYSSLNHTLFLQQLQQQANKSSNITTTTKVSTPIKEEPIDDDNTEDASIPTPNNSITKSSKTKRKLSASKTIKSSSTLSTTKSKSTPSPPSLSSEPTSPSDDSSNGKRKSCNRWTKNENELLIKAIEKYGEKKWNEIAKMVATKNSDQCNQHWWRVLNPKICKKPWNEEEDAILVDKVGEFGESAWKTIADSFQGRTDIQCRHRWIMLRKYEQEGKGRPVSRTNITCNSNVAIPQKLKDTLETSPQQDIKRINKKKRSVSNVSAKSSADSHLSNEGDLLCNEDPFQPMNTSSSSGDEHLRTQFRCGVVQQGFKIEKRDESDHHNSIATTNSYHHVSLDDRDDLIDESVYNFDQQEILLCEGSAIIPFECKMEMDDSAVVATTNSSYECFNGCHDEEDEFIRQEIEMEEKMFNLHNNNMMDGNFQQMCNNHSKQIDPSKELASVFAEWDDFITDFMPNNNESRSSSRQSYISDCNFDVF